MNDVKKLISQLIEMNCVSLSLTDIKRIYLARTKGLNSPGTYDNYRRNLNYIVEYLTWKNVLTTDQITFEKIYLYIDFERSKGNKNNTIRARIGILKQALEYSENNGYISSNALRKFKLPPKDDIETKIIPQDIIKDIFAYMNNLDKQKKVNYRNIAVTYLLYDTGIRFNEMRELRLKNIDLENREIFLTKTKSKKYRTVIMSESTKVKLIEYIEFCNVTDYLYVNVETNERINRVHYYKFLERVRIALSIPKDISISPHKYRHTMATVSLNNGANIEYVRKVLGHSSLIITQKYLHLDKTEIKKVHDRTSPMNFL